jgi:hypothetical protein
MQKLANVIQPGDGERNSGRRNIRLGYCTVEFTRRRRETLTLERFRNSGQKRDVDN